MLSNLDSSLEIELQYASYLYWRNNLAKVLN